MRAHDEQIRVDPGRLVLAHEEALRFYRGLLLDQYAGWPRQHLASRGLGYVLEPSSRWAVGYAPRGWTVLVEHLGRLGFRVDELDASGLATRTHRGHQVDRFRDRIVVPIRDASGSPVAFVGRARSNVASRVPRYLNSPATAVYRKGEILLGLGDQLRELRAGAVPVVVEGPTDLLAVGATAGLARSGFAVVAACGSSLTTDHATALRRASSSDVVVVATDSDRAGMRAAARAYGVLRREFAQVRSPCLPSGADPADVLRTGGAAILKDALTRARPLAHRLIEEEVRDSNPILDHLGGRLGTLRAVAPLVAQLPRNERAAEVIMLSRRLRIEHDLVTAVIADVVAPEPTNLRRRVHVRPAPAHPDHQPGARSGVERA